MAAMLHNSVAVAIATVVQMHPRSRPVTMIAMRKSIHGALLGGPRPLELQYNSVMIKANSYATGPGCSKPDYI